MSHLLYLECNIEHVKIFTKYVKKISDMYTIFVSVYKDNTELYDKDNLSETEEILVNINDEFGNKVDNRIMYRPIILSENIWITFETELLNIAGITTTTNVKENNKDATSCKTALAISTISNIIADMKKLNVTHINFVINMIRTIAFDGFTSWKNNIDTRANRLNSSQYDECLSKLTFCKKNIGQCGVISSSATPVLFENCMGNCMTSSQTKKIACPYPMGIRPRNKNDSMDVVKKIKGNIKKWCNDVNSKPTFVNKQIVTIRGLYNELSSMTSPWIEYDSRLDNIAVINTIPDIPIIKTTSITCCDVTFENINNLTVGDINTACSSEANTNLTNNNTINTNNNIQNNKQNNNNNKQNNNGSEKSSGLPTGAIIGIVAAVVFVIFIIIFLAKKKSSNTMSYPYMR